ncbi:hypothetical protein [Bradyrhizobium sp. CCBAU 51745]|uniref:hypothetical protein n=1 Tax=Bradyrhizobium sp. CCBAU 51745 TaxID=1325099 RepID=UPI0023069C77|nr:hypothetical protein [Bradyrhizobium sp. CCBAU 51745]
MVLPLQWREIAEVVGEFDERHLPGLALVANLDLLQRRLSEGLRRQPQGQRACEQKLCDPARGPLPREEI